MNDATETVDYAYKAAQACKAAATLFIEGKAVEARKQLLKAVYASDRLRHQQRSLKASFPRPHR